MTRPGHSSIGGSPRWAYCAISGGSLSRYQSLRASRRRFFSAGWPGTGPGKRRIIRLRVPRPPPWAGGEIAANLECLLYYIAVFLLSTRITDPSCARLMWPGHGGLFHPSQPPTRRKGAASCTTTICGSVFPWWSRRRSRQNRRASHEHAVAVAYSAGRVSSCTSGRALHSADYGCGPSRPARLR